MRISKRQLARQQLAIWVLLQVLWAFQPAAALPGSGRQPPVASATGCQPGVTAGAGGARKLLCAPDSPSPPPRPTTSCKAVQGYTVLPDRDHWGDDISRAPVGKRRPADLAARCNASCACKGFTTDGRLKRNVTLTFGSAKPGACLYVRNTSVPCGALPPPRLVQQAVVRPPPPSPPPPSGPPPPDSELLGPSCSACIQVSVRLRWALRDGRSGSNPPLTQAQCDAFAAYVSNGTLGATAVSVSETTGAVSTSSSLAPFTCTAAPAPSSDGWSSAMSVCAEGDREAVAAWMDVLGSDVNRPVQHAVASQLGVSFCWVGVSASSPCFPEPPDLEHWACD